ncbi:MAG: hypothetical protein N2Z21_09310 [Candidatus Sumerlaeaceae bacterium]|nr:hypothetical protein [Candidatus Sumerlaeaceae bacterium]
MKDLAIRMPGWLLLLLVFGLEPAGWGRVETFPLTTGTIVLVGEKPRTQRAGQPPITVDVETIVSQTLPAMRLVNMTVDKEPLDATLQRAAKAANLSARAVVIFTGSSENLGAGDDEKLRAKLVELIRLFTRKDAEVFVVPSATFVGADVCAVLRMAADDAAVHYLEPGVEIVGDPFGVVIEGIGRILTARATVQTPARPVVVAVEPPAPTDTSTSGTVITKPGATPATIYMVAPPPLKRFDPRETPKARKRLGRVKQPAFEN